MPRSQREYLLRYADQALNDLDRSLEKLKKLEEIYQDTHAEHAELIARVAQMIIMVETVLQDFRDNHM